MITNGIIKDSWLMFSNTNLHANGFNNFKLCYTLKGKSKKGSLPITCPRSLNPIL